MILPSRISLVFNGLNQQLRNNVQNILERATGVSSPPPWLPKNAINPKRYYVIIDLNQSAVTGRGHRPRRKRVCAFSSHSLIHRFSLRQKNY
jgi:hypothetical protein